MAKHGAMDYADDGPTADLCRFVVETGYEDVPPGVLERVRYLALDGICCALVGAHLPWSELAYRAVSGAEPQGSAPVWGWGVDVSPYSAAVLNSTFIEGFELDDYHEFGAIHSSSVVLPAAFAAARQPGMRRGRNVLLALAMGYEVGPRLGMSIGGYGGMLERGWHCGSVIGTVAAAATAGKVRGLTPHQMQDAFGIAGTQSAGLMAGQYEAMAKRMDHGFSARAGAMAADLAAEGYTGIKRVFEREYGGMGSAFSYPDQPDLGNLLTDIGRDWELERIIVKPFPASGTASLTIEAMLQARQRGVRPEDVVEVEVALPEHPYLHVGFDLARPATVIGAQMNAAYLGAVALIDGEVTTQQFTPERLDADDVWELMGRFRVVADAEMEEVARTQGYNRATEARLTLADGRRETVRVLLGPGTRDRLLTNREIEEKFDRYLQEVSDEKHGQVLKEMVLGLEELDDVADLQHQLQEQVRSPFDR